MEGGCSCNYGDSEPPEAFDETFPRAREQLECHECNAIISTGEKYQLVEATWDGEASIFETCLPCFRIREDHCMDYGDLRTQIWQELGINLTTGEMIDDD